MMANLQKHRGALLDLGCILLLGLAVLVFELLAHPHRRGFFCDDESIRYPDLPNTVPTGLLVAVSFLLPIVVFASVEVFRLLYVSTPRDSWHSVSTGLLVSVYEIFGVFLLGSGFNQLMVDVGKFFVGRLRPHFWDVCRPLGDVCPTDASPLLYVTDYVCSGDERSVEEARLSFPSGHAALAFYAAVYTAVFLQFRLLPVATRLFTHLAQAFLLLLAWYTALSRVMDYAHHPTDVMAGGVIGTVWALLMVTYVIDLRLDSRQRSQEELRALRPPTSVVGNIANNV